MAHDHGDPTQGPSDDSFRSALEGMGHEPTPSDFKARERAVGREARTAVCAGDLSASPTLRSVWA
jgi:hypothetical protein